MDPASGGGGGGGSGVLGGYAGPGVKAAGAIMSAIGQWNEGTAGQAMYRYKAGMAQLNKQLALRNADYSRKVGEVQAGESGMRGRFLGGKIAVGQAASGTDVNFGSNVDVRKSQTQIAQMDQGIIRANAARRAYGYEVEAAKDESESQMDIAAGEQVKSASRLAGWTSIIGGSASVADKWAQASQYGLFPSSSPDEGWGDT